MARREPSEQGPARRVGVRVPRCLPPLFGQSGEALARWAPLPGPRGAAAGRASPPSLETRAARWSCGLSGTSRGEGARYPRRCDP